MNHETPVNKQAAKFLSRKRRVDSLQEALNRFAMEISSPVTVEAVRKLMRDSVKDDDRSRLTISMSIGPDFTNRTQICAIMASRIQVEQGREVMNGLEL